MEPSGIFHYFPYCPLDNTHLPFRNYDAPVEEHRSSFFPFWAVVFDFIDKNKKVWQFHGWSRILSPWLNRSLELIALHTFSARQNMISRYWSSDCLQSALQRQIGRSFVIQRDVPANKQIILPQVNAL